MATLNVKNFPDDVYERLRELADREHRSISQQVVHMLSEATSEPEPLALSDLRGLGEELWEGVEAAEHVERERRAWD